jgi:iron complex outermembrane receptor protein
MWKLPINKSFVFLSFFLQSIAVSANQDDTFEHYLSLSIEELIELEITISTDTKKAIMEAPSTVTVITSNDFKVTGATNLVEILEDVPGIHIRMNQFGYRPLIHIRGANAKQTLLMVNGVPMRDLLWGFGIFWKGLPVSAIERVEIIRGPGSALFGADASAGVINVITKSAGKIKNSEIGLRRGSFDTNTGWLQYGENWQGFDIGLTMEYYNTDGFSPYIEEDFQTNQDQENGTHRSLAPGYTQFGWENKDIRFSIAKSHWQLLMDYLHHKDVQTGLSGTGVIDPVTKGSDKRFNIDLLYSNDAFDSNWGLDSELRYQNLEYSSGDGFQETPPGRSDEADLNSEIYQWRAAERRVAFEVSGLYSGFDQHAIRLGTGYKRHDLYRIVEYTNTGIGPDGNELPDNSGFVDLSDTPYAFAPEKSRKIRHFFIQNIIKLDQDWELTAGLRHDHYSDFGSTYNPRLALVWNTTEKLTSKLLYGRAFRPPSFQELYSSTTNAQPNADLIPERSETLELALSYLLSTNLTFGLNIYQYQQYDIISRVPIPNSPYYQFANAGEHTIHGIELESKWQPTPNLHFTGNYTIRNQDNSNYRAASEPDQDAHLRIDWAFQTNWSWNIQSNWVGDRTRGKNDSRPSLDDHTITNTTLRYNPLKHWEFAISIRNLFDEEALEHTSPKIPGDLPLPERNIYAEIRYNFEKPSTQ